MRKVLLAAAAILVVLLVAVQVVLPRIISGEVEKRLTQDGGTAEVSISAIPALTLATGRGRSIEISGDDLVYDLDERKERPFERLDGFGDVRIDLRDLDAGAVKLSSFTLSREGRDEPYELSMRGTSTPRDLASELGTATGGTLGGLLGGLASGVLPDGGVGTVPLRMDATVNSDDGRPRIDSARATVAGVPAGRLTEIVLRSVLERL